MLPFIGIPSYDSASGREQQSAGQVQSRCFHVKLFLNDGYETTADCLTRNTRPIRQTFSIYNK